MATVLLADDDAELLEMYGLWLQPLEGVTIRTASNGVEAKKRVDESVDVAVIDRRMPKATGDEAARAIRSKHPNCDVVVVSAFEPDDGIAEDDYDRYLTKPLQREQLVTAISRGLNRPLTTDQ